MYLTILLNVIFTLAVAIIACIAVKKARASRNRIVRLNEILTRFKYELFEFAPDSLLLMDSHGIIVNANTQTERLFGWKSVELIGQSIETLVPRKVRSNHSKLRLSFTNENRERLMISGRFGGGLTELRKDNSTFVAEISLKPIEYKGEKLTIVAVHDVSDRVNIHDEIGRVMIALDASDDAIFIYDARTLRITYANEGAARQLGYTRNEFLLMTPEEIKSGESRSSFHEKLRKTVNARGKTQNYIDYHLSKDGREFPVELNTRFIDHPDRPYIVSVGRDISKQILALDCLDSTSSNLKRANQELELERKNLEEEVTIRTQLVEKSKKKAEDANMAKSAFLAAMSHEIRTPMNGVLGMIELLLTSSLDSQQLKRVTTLQDSAQCLLQIIDDILDFSKIEAGKFELANEAIDLIAITDSIYDSLLAIADSKNVSLSCYRDPALAPVIISDALRLRQIVTNLVGNSIKFSSGLDRRGNVRLRFEAVTGDVLRIIVEDNGIGIKKESLKAIFDPFKQENISTAHQFGGTGLGLPITKVLVEKMQGTLDIESEPGVSTKVTVKFPIVVADESCEPEFARLLQGFLCILYCNDEDQTKDRNSYFTYVGAKVHHVNTPREFMNTSNLNSNIAAKRISVAIDTELSADYLQSLAAIDVNRSMTKFIVVMPLSNKVVDIVNEQLTLIDSNPNINTTFREVLNSICGNAGILKTTVEIKESITPIHVNEDISANVENKILVAEDNAINQNVIGNQLEALGYTYQLASNGKEALELWHKNNYAMLLTDLHMPVMDGYALAVEIRKQETNAERLPIVAYTANALKGEKDRCLESGMDDYLTKPIALKDLKSKLATWANSSSTNITLKASNTVKSGTQIKMSTSTLDISILEKIVGFDSKVIFNFLSDYREAVNRASSDMGVAFQNKNWEAMKSIAHTLKSLSRTMGAITLGEVCAALEDAVRQRNEIAVNDAMSNFDEAMDDVYAALTMKFAQEKDSKQVNQGLKRQ